jgi:uracil-DNA glycosylase
LKTDLLLKEAYKQDDIYPPKDIVFRALQLTPFEKTKVVILGQDPYHGEGEANGLAFSVNNGIKIPPSLRNIFKELQNDLGYSPPTSGDLTAWAKQGVLLLNSVLTVKKDFPASHRNLGWQKYTDSLISELSSKKENLVYILWGKYAQEKITLIDGSKHMVIQSPHPSPFSANRGFFGSKPFSKTNTYLKSKGISEIDWRLTT